MSSTYKRIYSFYFFDIINICSLILIFGIIGIAIFEACRVTIDGSVELIPTLIIGLIFMSLATLNIYGRMYNRIFSIKIDEGKMLVKKLKLQTVMPIDYSIRIELYTAMILPFTWIIIKSKDTGVIKFVGWVPDIVRKESNLIRHFNKNKIEYQILWGFQHPFLEIGLLSAMWRRSIK